MANADEQRLSSFVRTLEADASIVAVNKMHIKSFYTYMRLRAKAGRLSQLVMECIYWAHLIKKDFSKCTKADIQEATEKLLNESNYTAYTKVKKLTVLKQLYKHLLGDDDEYPDVVRWIKTKNLNLDFNQKKASDMITRDDLRQLLESCNSAKEAALVYFLWESGVRASELTGITLGNIVDKGQYLTVEVSGKTGTRNIAIVESGPYLKKFINEHPKKNDKNAYLFYTTYNHQLVPLAIRILNLTLHRIASRAGVTKNVNPHQFRHSAASEQAPRTAGAAMCDRFGWRQGSKMPGTYIHVKNEQANAEYLKQFGIDTAATQPHAVEMMPCPNCKADNVAGTVFCTTCGKVLSTAAAMDVEEQLRQMQAKIDRMMLPRSRGMMAKSHRDAQRKMLRVKKAD